VITTLDIKNQKYHAFKAGDPNGIPVLIQGSCRATPYLNYFNSIIPSKYCLYFIDPFNFNWDENENISNLQQELIKQESNQFILSILPRIKIFIHEHYQSFGMFNTSLSSDKHIYQFGLYPDLDICLPNFHDHFILFKDFLLHDWFKIAAIQANEELSQLPDSIISRVEKESNQAINKFLHNCSLSSFPEMAHFFQENWLSSRLFCSFNHISKSFSFKIWQLMNEKFLHIPPSQAYSHQIKDQSIYENNQTPLTNYDLLIHPYNWNEPISNL
jgi:hypothetical protein